MTKTSKITQTKHTISAADLWMLLGMRHLLLQEVLGRLQAVVLYKSLCKDKHMKKHPHEQKKG